MYSTYIAGFEDAMKLLTEWTAKEKRFDTLVRDFAVSGGKEGERERGREGIVCARRRERGRGCILAHWQSQHIPHFLCSGTPPVDSACPTTCWNLHKDYRDTSCC